MMNKNTGTLYRYELKKITRSKLTVAMMIILVGSGFSGHWEIIDEE